MIGGRHISIISLMKNMISHRTLADSTLDKMIKTIVTTFELKNKR